MTYKIHLDKFEGPLDLLLFLIKKNDVDIYDIPIALVTGQYMEYISMMKILDLEIVGDFLVMAATLMQIKSRMLLPPDPLALQEPGDPRSELVRRLEEYQRIKAVAEELKLKESHQQDLFKRLVDEATIDELKEDAREVFIEATLFDLINAFSDALRHIPERKDYEISKEEFTVEGKVHELLHLLVDTPQISLVGLLCKSRNKDEAICLFVAVLELIRLKEVVVIQRRQFDEIVVIRNTTHEAPVDPLAQG